MNHDDDSTHRAACAGRMLLLFTLPASQRLCEAPLSSFKTPHFLPLFLSSSPSPKKARLPKTIHLCTKGPTTCQHHPHPHTCGLTKKHTHSAASSSMRDQIILAGPGGGGLFSILSILLSSHPSLFFSSFPSSSLPALKRFYPFGLFLFFYRGSPSAQTRSVTLPSPKMRLHRIPSWI